MIKKWKYSEIAGKTRYCELCQKQLNKKEVVICIFCYKKEINEKQNTGGKIRW